MTILEKYKNRIGLAEQVYAQSHNGEAMDMTRKLVLAKTIDNTNKYLTEAVDPASGTNRSNMGDYKRFCIAMTNLAVPNLIAPDLVHTVPMTSFVGNLAYAQFQAGINKAPVTQGQVFNDPWTFGYDSHYTSNMVIDTFAGDGVTVTWPFSFDPTGDTSDDEKYKDYGMASPYVIMKVIVDGTEMTSGYAIDSTYANKITFSAAPANNAVIKVAYIYDNITLPQENIPTLKVDMRNITLEARARRLAIRYSQMAAFQAKQDYGMSLDTELAKQAVGELNYEIDTEICNMLANANAADSALTWSKTLPVGVSKRDHYAGFSEILERGRVAVYKATQKHMPNVLLVSPEIIPVLNFVPGYEPSMNANNGNFSGPFQCGIYNGCKVFCNPNMASNTYCWVVNKGALEATAGVFAPYMPIIPTAVLQGPDGGTAQGWSTLYDAKLLNANLVKNAIIVD